MVLLQISYALQQWKNFENRLRFDKVRESLKAGTFFETQCTFLQPKIIVIELYSRLTRGVTAILYFPDNNLNISILSPLMCL